MKKVRYLFGLMAALALMLVGPSANALTNDLTTALTVTSGVSTGFDTGATIGLTILVFLTALAAVLKGIKVFKHR